MAGATESARYFLEQCIPELRELERQGLFSTEEVSAIAKKRSEFEHRVNGRTAKPADYAHYVEFELNLEFLRQKRARRIGRKKPSQTWQRRSMALMERATTKFPGDMALWMQYAELARKQKSFKKLSKILTSMVRLHAAVPEAWIYAATYAMDELGDMVKARSYMQRGLRFCKTSQAIWLEYGRLEMAYLAKIQARRAILGLDEAPKAVTEATTHDEPDADMIVLPTVTSEEFKRVSGLDGGTQETAKDLSMTPALSGAIFKAIFDAAVDQFQDDELGAQFFTIVASFHTLPCSKSILQQILDRLNVLAPKSTATLDVFIRQPLVGVDASASDFPQALSEALRRLDQSLLLHPSTNLILKSVNWISAYLANEGDADVRDVLSTMVVRLLQRCKGLIERGEDPDGENFTSVLQKLQAHGLGESVLLSMT